MRPPPQKLAFISFCFISQFWPGCLDFKMAAKARRTRKRKLQETGVSFAPGFHLPTSKQSRDAIGLSLMTKNFEPGPVNVHFQEIPQPSCEDDWLAQYNEEGQSFKSFMRTCPWISGRKVKQTKQRFIPEGNNLKERYPDGKIYIQPLGDFDQSDSDCCPAMVDLAEYTACFYVLPVVVLPAVKLKIPKKEGKQSHLNLQVIVLLKSNLSSQTETALLVDSC